MRRILNELAATVAILFLVAISGVQAGTINVPGDYSTIQEAIDNANPGDTINIAPGIYTENIVVDEEVTIAGAGPGSTIIDNAGMSADPMIIKSSNVNIMDLTVTNGTGNSRVRIYDGTPAFLNNITFDNVIVSELGYAGIEVHHEVVNNLVIQGTTCTGNGKHGFRVDSGGEVYGLFITNSHFDVNDAGFTNYGRVENAMIQASTFNHNFANTGATWTGGYGLFSGWKGYGENWTIKNCQFNNNDYNHTKYPSGNTHAYGAELTNGGGAINTNFNFKNCEFANNGKSGVELSAWDTTGYINNVTITHSELKNNGNAGLEVIGDVSDVIVYCSNIVGNTNFGVYNGVSPTVNATYNWWGDASGPAPTGSGDTISGNVEYDPWLPRIFQLCPRCVPQPVPAVSTIGLIALAGSLGLIAAVMIKRR